MEFNDPDGEDDEYDDDGQDITNIGEAKAMAGAAGIYESRVGFNVKGEADGVLPEHRGKPTLAALMRTCQRPRDPADHVYGAGDWVELRGVDLVWRLAQIYKVDEMVKHIWDDPEPKPQKVYFFETPQGNIKAFVVHDDDIRAPEEGLKALFGNAPWLWQQYALLQMEYWLKFERDDLADFENINIYDLAFQWWDAWLKDPRNGDFDAFYNEQDVAVRDLLGHHILSEFKLMQRIRDDDDNWDFSDEDITVYTYLATLGDGLVTVFFTLLIQIAVPSLIVINTIDRGTESEVDPPPQISDFPGGFCVNNLFDGGTEGFIIVEKLVLMLVSMIYMLKVIPDTLYSFYNVSGLSGSTYARLNSLRNTLYLSGKDSGYQWLGFKLDRWMNTAYLNFLYLAMLFILYLTENVLDIILNALAIDFIHEIDEKLANAAWWDRDYRWITAGCIEMVIQANLDLNTLTYGRKLCTAYGINQTAYKSTFGSMKGMRDKSLANEDAVKPEYARALLQGRNNHDLDTVEIDKVRSFGFIDSFLAKCFCSDNVGVFHKYFDFRTWSKWEKVIYLPEAHNAKDINEAAHEFSRKELYDFFPQNTFFHRVGCEILTFVEAGRNMKHSINNRSFSGFIAHFIAGFIDWMTYSLPLIFPLAVLLSTIVYTICR